MKNSSQRINSGLDESENQIRGLEGKGTENNQSSKKTSTLPPKNQDSNKEPLKQLQGYRH